MIFSITSTLFTKYYLSVGNRPVEHRLDSTAVEYLMISLDKIIKAIVSEGKDLGECRISPTEKWIKLDRLSAADEASHLIL